MIFENYMIVILPYTQCMELYDRHFRCMELYDKHFRFMGVNLDIILQPNLFECIVISQAMVRPLEKKKVFRMLTLKKKHFKKKHLVLNSGSILSLSVNDQNVLSLNDKPKVAAI